MHSAKWRRIRKELPTGTKNLWIFVFAALARVPLLCRNRFNSSMVFHLIWFACEFRLLVSFASNSEAKRNGIFSSLWHKFLCWFLWFYVCTRFLVDSKETNKLNEKSLWSAIYQVNATHWICTRHTHTRNVYGAVNQHRETKDFFLVSSRQTLV